MTNQIPLEGQKYIYIATITAVYPTVSTLCLLCHRQLDRQVNRARFLASMSWFIKCLHGLLQTVKKIKQSRPISTQVLIQKIMFLDEKEQGTINFNYDRLIDFPI